MMDRITPEHFVPLSLPFLLILKQFSLAELITNISLHTCY